MNCRLFLSFALLTWLHDGTMAGSTPFRRATDRVPGLDPAQAASASAARMVGLLYECLLEYDHDERPYRLRPGLAAELPERSPDGLTYTFRLRDDARFMADPCFGVDAFGRPLDRAVRASDVVFSLTRLADPRVASPGAWTVRDRIVGIDAFRARVRGDTVGIAGTEAIEGLEALDDRRLRMHLRQADAQWAWILAMPYTAVVPPEAVAYYGDAFASHPVGSGPYRLEHWRRNYRIALARRKEWHGWDTALESLPGQRQGIPFDRLHFLVIDDPATQWMAFLSGMLDVQGDVARDQWDAVVGPDGRLLPDIEARGIRMQRAPSLDTAYVGFNFADPLLSTNRPLRQAMNMAFDADSWERFHMHRVQRAEGPVPPGIDGRLKRHSPLSFDLERARERMIAAGYSGGIDPRSGRRLVLSIDVGSADVEMRESTELLVAFMSRIGIDLQPRYSHWPAFLARVSRRETQLFRLSWLADYPDAENFLQLFYSPNASPGPNRVNYSDPRYDALFESARELSDPAQRNERYREMQAHLREDPPWIFLHHRVALSLSHARVEGFRPHSFPYGMERYLRTPVNPASREPTGASAP